jgi:hypothetical protein
LKFTLDSIKERTDQAGCAIVRIGASENERQVYVISHLFDKTTSSFLGPLGIGRVNRWDPYDRSVDIGSVSKAAFETAKKIRGINRPPAIIIHGVTPRCGSVYVGELLRLHPDIHAYPNGLWEVPFLRLTGEFLTAQQRFFRFYGQNKGKIEDNDFLPLFGAALIGHLYSFVPEDKTMLLKVPDVSFLYYFPLLFPFEDIILLLRDGRDVVASTIKTWPKTKFSRICDRWAKSAELMFEFNKRHEKTRQNCSLVKFEQIVNDPEKFVKDTCLHYGLSIEKFPFEKISTVPARGSSTLQSSGQVDWNARSAPKDFKPGGGWRSWSAKQKKIFKRIAGRALIDTGYCENLEW